MTIPLGLGQATALRNVLAFSNSGKPYLGVEVLVDGSEENETQWAKIYLTDAAMGIARQKLKLCGWDIDKKGLNELKRNENALSGARVAVFVEEKQGSNGTYISVDITLQEKPIDEASLDAITEKLRNVKSGSGAPKAPAQAKSAKPAAAASRKPAARGPVAPAEPLLSAEDKARLDAENEGKPEDIPF